MKKIKALRIVNYKDVCDAENILNDNIDQAVFNQNDCVVIKKNGYVVLDYGKEINGGVLITTQNVSPDAKYRIVFGESVMEAMSTIGEKSADNHHSIRDMIVPAVFMSTQRFGQTGFRFVKIEAVDGDITLRSAKAVSDTKELKYVGSFECNDELLNVIWRVGAYTVHLNMNHYLWDGVKRDRLVWIGDMHPETSTIRTVFGNDNCIKESLEMIKNETPSDSWMNRVPTYSMWWIIIQYDLYMHWGDFEYLSKQKEYITAVTANLMSWIDNEYKTDLKLGRFVDWSSRNQDCELDGVKAIACVALKCAHKIFCLLGNEEHSERCRVYFEKLCNEEESGIEPNNRIAALTVLSGRISENAKSKILETTVNEMSCFMGYYILLSLAKLGEYNKAIELIKDYWGAMIKLGATTFWEEFKPEWAKNAARIDEITPEGKIDIHGTYGEHCYNQYRLSLCHGWASGPTPFLSEHLGGIEILAPSCKKMRIKPNGAGLEWFNISYPTPYGTVKIRYENKNGEEKVTVDAPEEIEIIQ